VEAIKDKVIFLVGNGFLGQKIVSVFRQKGAKVITADAEAKADYSLDITDGQSMIYLFRDINPDIVLLPAGITNVDYCESEKEKATEVNVQGTRNIIDSCRAFNSKLVFFSTDYVFDGKKGNYTEKDEVNPVNFYGKTKVEGEKFVQGLEDYLIARVSALYGFNSAEDKNTFVRHAVNELKQGKEIAAAKLINCPTLIDDVAEAVYLMLEKNFSGLFHVAGSEPCSKYSLLKKICKVYGFDSCKIKEIPAISKWTAERPFNTSLDTTKIQLQGIKMSSVEEGLLKMKKEMKQ